MGRGKKKGAWWDFYLRVPQVPGHTRCEWATNCLRITQKTGEPNGDTLAQGAGPQGLWVKPASLTRLENNLILWQGNFFRL